MSVECIYSKAHMLKITAAPCLMSEVNLVSFRFWTDRHRYPTNSTLADHFMQTHDNKVTVEGWIILSQCMWLYVVIQEFEIILHSPVLQARVCISQTHLGFLKLYCLFIHMVDSAYIYSAYSVFTVFSKEIDFVTCWVSPKSFVVISRLHIM